MTSMIGDTGSQNASYINRMLSRLDADSNGSISRTEFVDGRPGDVSEDQAGSLFDSLDSSQSGSLSISGLTGTFQQMSSTTQATLLETQQIGGQGPDASRMFSTLDADEDGTLTKEEFLAGRPDNVSEADAESLWSSMAGDDTSLSRDQFADAMQKAGPPPTQMAAGERPAGDSSSLSGETVSQQLLAQLTEAIKTYQSNSAASYTSRAASSLSVFAA